MLIKEEVEGQPLSYREWLSVFFTRCKGKLSYVKCFPNQSTWLFVTDQQNSEELVPFRCYARGILAAKYKAKPSVFEEVKTILKRVHPKRINILQTTGIDENPRDAITILFQGIEQLACRGAIEIANEF
jgi:hypothetical protein